MKKKKKKKKEREREKWIFGVVTSSLSSFCVVSCDSLCPFSPFFLSNTKKKKKKHNKKEEVFLEAIPKFIRLFHTIPFPSSNKKPFSQNFPRGIN